MREKVENMNTPKQIGRRSLFKIIAAVMGAGAAFKIGKYNQERKEENKG